MIVLYRLAARRLSPVGISAVGAAGHALGQVLAARLLVIQHPAIWKIFPLFLSFTVFAGILTGWLACGLLEQLRQHPAFQSPASADRCGEQ
jgi:heptaprenyl diphosphate synthase